MLPWHNQYNSQSELGISQVPLCISGGSANRYRQNCFFTQLDGHTTDQRNEACDADGSTTSLELPKQEIHGLAKMVLVMQTTLRMDSTPEPYVK